MTTVFAELPLASPGSVNYKDKHSKRVGHLLPRKLTVPLFVQTRLCATGDSFAQKVIFCFMKMLRVFLGGNIYISWLACMIYSTLEGTARYRGLLLAPAEGFGQKTGF